MTTLDFIVLMLSASACVDVWRNAELFATQRAYLEAAQDGDVRWAWFATLMNCPYCLSHHTPWLLAVTFYVPAMILVAVAKAWESDTLLTIAFVLKIPVYSLAATRGAVLADLLLPDRAKYSREEFVNTEDDEEDEDAEEPWHGNPNPTAETIYAELNWMTRDDLEPCFEPGELDELAESEARARDDFAANLWQLACDVAAGDKPMPKKGGP